MKHFLKVFIMTSIILSVIAGISSYAYIQFQDEDPIKISEEDEELEEFGEEIKLRANKDKINVLFLGVDGERADTIILGSYSLNENKVELTAIPRDTYYEGPYYGAQMKKINAMYTVEGVKGMINAVEDVLNMEDEINYYVEIDYDGVKSIVDSVGGVEVDVPFDMVYSDPYASPPLNINIREGTQVLKGQKAVGFLRYRTNNSYTQGYQEGDLGRIKAQQEFIASFTDKAIGLKLPSVIKTSMNEVRTNVGLKDALSYGTKLVKLRPENIEMSTLPGEARYEFIEGENLSYFFADEFAVESIEIEDSSVR